MAAAGPWNKAIDAVAAARTAHGAAALGSPRQSGGREVPVLSGR